MSAIYSGLEEKHRRPLPEVGSKHRVIDAIYSWTERYPAFGDVLTFSHEKGGWWHFDGYETGWMPMCFEPVSPEEGVKH